MTPDDLREQARQVRIFDELAVMISPDHADALADLIDAVAAHKASFDSPNADVVVRARCNEVDRLRAVVVAADEVWRCKRCNGGGLIAPGNCCQTCAGDGIRVEWDDDGSDLYPLIDALAALEADQ